MTVGKTFTEVVGISRLDVCTWSLAPRTICDFKPAPLSSGTSVVCP